jgi:hypothetical protein
VDVQPADVLTRQRHNVIDVILDEASRLIHASALVILTLDLQVIDPKWRGSLDAIAPNPSGLAARLCDFVFLFSQAPIVKNIEAR